MNKRTAIYLAVLILLAPVLGYAADERAKRDLNKNPVLMGITTDTVKQIRMLRTSQEGFLLIESTKTQPVSGSVSITGGNIVATPIGCTNIGVSTAAVSDAGATLLAAANSDRKQLTICNEDEDGMRIGPASVTADVGTLLLGDTCAADGGGVSITGAVFGFQTGTGSGKASIWQCD